MPDGVTGAGAAARDVLDRGRGALLGIHGGLVGVLRPGGDGPLGLHPHVEDEDPVGLEVLALVVDDGLDHILVLVVGEGQRRGGGVVDFVEAARGIGFVPALRGVGNPVDVRATLGQGQLGALNPVGVGDGHAGTVGDLGAGNHDPPVDGGLIIAGEPTGLEGHGGKRGVVADALLPTGKRHLGLDAVAEDEGELVSIGALDHLGPHPQRSADVVLALDVGVQGAGDLAPRHLAGAVGQRIAVLALQLEASDGAVEFPGQAEFEGVPGFSGAVGNPPVRVDPDAGPEVELGILLVDPRDADASRIDGVHLGGLRSRTPDDQTGHADQECEQESHRPPLAARFDPLQHVVSLPNHACASCPPIG